MNVENLQKLRESLPPRRLKVIEQFQAVAGNLAGKKILDLGNDNRGEISALIASLGANVTGINLQETNVNWDNCRFLRGDAIRAPFKNCSFDFVVSVNTFEHFLRPDKCLKEIHRVLKWGGICYTSFAPVWSCGVGHHLWFPSSRKTGVLKIRFDKPDSYFIQPYMHLLWDEGQMFEHLRKHYNQDESKLIVANIYKRKGLNRLMLNDILELFNNSRLEIIKTNMFLPWKYYLKSYKENIKQLHHKYGKEHNFLNPGIIIVLKKVPDLTVK